MADPAPALGGAFDLHHPPPRGVIDDCVRCGFCLPTCPTYVLFGEEMDSPRGRIHLMKVGLEGEPMTPTMVEHFDLCLGCMACVTSCPSGVRYDELIEATRQQVERRHPRSAGDRLFRWLVFRVFPYPRRLGLLVGPLNLYRRLRVDALFRRVGLVRLLPGRLRAMESLLPGAVGRPVDLPERIPARGTANPRRRVGLLTGCVQRVFFSRVNAATARVLVAEGCEVTAPRAQGCCGALSMHAGREREAQAFARCTIDTFERAGVDAVVVNAAGCGSTMKEYGRLLADDPAYAERALRFAKRVRDVSEFLVEVGSVAVRHPLPATAVYQDACHLAHAQGVRLAPRAVLAGIPGLDVIELREPELCCGSAGIYNLLEPGPARELGDRKAARVLETEAELLITANPGCALQLRAALERAGREMPIVHPVELLDAAIRGLSADGLPTVRRPLGARPSSSP